MGNNLRLLLWGMFDIWFSGFEHRCLEFIFGLVDYFGFVRLLCCDVVCLVYCCFIDLPFIIAFIVVWRQFGVGIRREFSEVLLVIVAVDRCFVFR